MFRQYRLVTAVFAVFSLVYLLQSTLVNPDQATLVKYHISAGQAKTLGLSVALPYIIIWCIALVGYLRLRFYADSIKGGKDGAAFQVIAKGLLWLALWLPISAVSSALATEIYTRHPGSTAALVIANNYLNLAVLCVGFILVDKGTRKLVTITRSGSVAPSQRLIVGCLTLATLYMFVIFNDPARRMPTSHAPIASYYQPDWLLVTTIVIPRIIMWFLGVQAVQNIYFYRQKTKGPIYRAGLDRLALGLSGVITASIVLRGLQSFTTQLSSLSLGLLLLVIYMLLIMISAGYVLIAKGARRLRQIEEL